MCESSPGRFTSPRITKFTRRAPRENHSWLISVTVPPRDFVFPQGSARQIWSRIISRLHAALSLFDQLCSDFCLSYTFQREPVKPYFNMALLRDARGQIWSETTFLICGVSTVDRLDDRTFRAFIKLASINSGEHKFYTTIVSWGKFYVFG